MLKKIHQLLKSKEFISVATCDLSGNPNAAPKFILKLDGHHIYLVDYTIGKTYGNLKVNPKISLSFMDTETLSGYQINGLAETVEAGAEYERVCKELIAKEVDLSARRIIEGVTTQKKHQNFEVAIRDKFVILKVIIKEIIEIGPSGQKKREEVTC